MHSLLVSQGRIEGKMDVLVARIGKTCSPTPPVAPPAATGISLRTFGKLVEHAGTIIRIGIVVGPLVLVAAKVAWKWVKSFFLG